MTTSAEPHEEHVDLSDLRQLVRTYVERHLFPLEATSPGEEFIAPEVLEPLQKRARDFGLWLVDVPSDLGGLGLGLLELCIVREELARTKTVSLRGNQVFGPYIPAVLFEACDAAQLQE